MKNLKIVIASLFLLTLTTVFATKASAQIYTTDYVYDEGGATPDFDVTTGTDADLQTQGNWSIASTTPAHSSGNKIAFVRLEDYVNDFPTEIPDLSTILSHLAASFDETNNLFNPNPIEIFDGSNNLQYRITIFFKP